jgi:hypothetical protein
MAAPTWTLKVRTHIRFSIGKRWAKTKINGPKAALINANDSSRYKARSKV